MLMLLKSLSTAVQPKGLLLKGKAVEESFFVFSFDSLLQVQALYFQTYAGGSIQSSKLMISDTLVQIPGFGTTPIPFTQPPEVSRLGV